MIIAVCMPSLQKHSWLQWHWLQWNTHSQSHRSQRWHLLWQVNSIVANERQTATGPRKEGQNHFFWAHHTFAHLFFLIFLKLPNHPLTQVNTSNSSYLLNTTIFHFHGRKCHQSLSVSSRSKCWTQTWTYIATNDAGALQVKNDGKKNGAQINCDEIA